MEDGSRAKKTFLSGIALCVVSFLLLFLGTAGPLNGDMNSTYFFVPLFFLATGIIAIAMSRGKKLHKVCD